MSSTSAGSGGSGGPIQSLIESRLRSTFSPTHLEIENESHRHSVPKGSESHFKIFVVSAAFDGVPLLQRHRMVNEAVSAGGALPVHALSISAKTPAQYDAGAKIQSTPGCAGGSKGDSQPVRGAGGPTA